MDGDGNISASQERKSGGFLYHRNLLATIRSLLFSYFGIYGTINLQDRKKTTL